MIYISDISDTGKIGSVFYMTNGINDIEYLGWDKSEKEAVGAFIDESSDFSTDKYLYVDNELIVDPNYIPPEHLDINQDELNLDFDFRIACLELGL